VTSTADEFTIQHVLQLVQAQVKHLHLNKTVARVGMVLVKCQSHNFT